MLPCFGSWNHKGEMLPFKAFQSMGNQGERALHVRRFFFYKFDTGYTSMT